MFCDFLMLGLDKVRSKFGTTALHRHNEAQAVLILYFKDYLLMWKYIKLVYKTGKLEIFGNQWIIEFKYKFKIISVYVHCTYIALHVFTQYVVNFAVAWPTLSNQSSLFNQKSTVIQFLGLKFINSEKATKLCGISTLGWTATT